MRIEGEDGGLFPIFFLVVVLFDSCRHPTLDVISGLLEVNDYS